MIYRNRYSFPHDYLLLFNVDYFLYIEMGKIVEIVHYGRQKLNKQNYFKVSNIRRTTTSSFSIQHLASIYCAKINANREEKYLSLGIMCGLYSRFDGK